MSFYSADGTELSLGTRFQNLFQLPFFQMRVLLPEGHQQEYNIVAQQSLDKSSIKYRMLAESKPFYDHCKSVGMTDAEARTIGTFDRQMLSQLAIKANGGASTVSHHELLNFSIVAMSQHAHWVRAERDILQRNLRILTKQVQPLEHLKMKCEEYGRIAARRWRNIFATTIMAQFALTQYCTYVAYSWDIVEPFTCILSFSDAVVAYLFWTMTGRNWDVAGFA